MAGVMTACRQTSKNDSRVKYKIHNLCLSGDAGCRSAAQYLTGRM
jgi:hypothetical protein